MIKLGQKVVCSVSGFAGVAIAKCEYYKGSTQFLVQAKIGTDGKINQEWIQVKTLKLVGKK